MRPALLGTLRDLQLDYLDLYLVRPNCNPFHSPLRISTLLFT